MLTFGLLSTGAAASLLCLSSFAAEEVSCACNNKVVVTGQFEHRPFDTIVIAGAAGNEVASKGEIKGRDFSCSVPDLKPGKYTVEIGLAELEFDRPGQRSFDILCGDKVLATNLDLFVAAGGMDKVLRICGDIEHAGDAAHGPLAVRFVARRGLAKLCTFEVRDANGATVVYMKVADLITGVDPASLAPPVVEGPVLWEDPTQPFEVRVKDLVKRMSLAEKASQMRNTAPAIPRLGLPAYNYWNECLHGVARSGVATVFPQAIGLAATWDTPLLHDVAGTISTEARAKHHEYARTHNGDSAKYFGLTFWTPNMNIFRDPRWGRGQETYGEDPFLTARMAVAFITGLQGNDPKYAKAMACAKHFAVHSGPESARHTFDAVVPERDFYETYLPHFEAAVREGKVWSVMGAYNSVYGEPACSSTQLLSDLLRKQWGFRGHVVSDCGAIFDIFANHKRVPTCSLQPWVCSQVKVLPRQWMVGPSSNSRLRSGETLAGASSAVNGRACRWHQAAGGDWSAALANVQAATFRTDCRPESASFSETSEKGVLEQPSRDRNGEGSDDREMSHQMNLVSQRGRGRSMDAKYAQAKKGR